MQKALLHSILLMTLVLPIVASRAKDQRKGLKKMVTWMALYAAVYVFALLYIYPRLEGR